MPADGVFVAVAATVCFEKVAAFSIGGVELAIAFAVPGSPSIRTFIGFEFVVGTTAVTGSTVTTGDPPKRVLEMLLELPLALVFDWLEASLVSLSEKFAGSSSVVAADDLTDGAVLGVA